MSTRPLGALPVVPLDPGPWSGVLEVVHRRGGIPGRRRAEPANGLMVSTPPRTALAMAGAEAGSPVAGVGIGVIAAGAREGALSLARNDDGTIVGVNKMVIRTWDPVTLAVVDEQRPDTDPAKDLPEEVWIDSLAEGELPVQAVTSPDGGYAAVGVVEPPRYRGLAIVRLSDQALVRYVRFGRCGLWNADGSRLFIGGEWGILALDCAPPEAVEGASDAAA